MNVPGEMDGVSGEIQSPEGLSSPAVRTRSYRPPRRSRTCKRKAEAGEEEELCDRPHKLVDVERAPKRAQWFP